MKYDRENDESEEMEKPKPTLHLCSEDFPEILEWEVGDSYKVLIDIKQVSKSEREDACTDGVFEINAIRELPKSKGEFSKDDVTAAIKMKNLDYLR